MAQYMLTIPNQPNPPRINFGADFTPQLAQAYDFVSRYFKDFDYRALVSDIKIVAIILTVILGVIFIIVLRKVWSLGGVKERLSEFKAEFKLPAETQTAYSNRWEEIKRHAASFVEAEWKLAVIEADKFVDDVLKTAGFAGESMGERLMLIKPDQLTNLQYLWDAHKLRNLLVHDPDFKLTHQQALFAINAFESVLKELSALI